MKRTGCLNMTVITENAAILEGMPDLSADTCTREELRNIPCLMELDEGGELCRVFYEERDAEGSITKNELIFQASCSDTDAGVRLLRRGPVSAEFSFAAGKSNMVRLDTPYGTAVITVVTEWMRSEKTEAGIAWEWRYRLQEAMEDHLIRYEFLD